MTKKLFKTTDLDFYLWIRKNNSMPDALNFLYLQKLGCGLFTMPNMAEEVGMQRPNFISSMNRLRNKGLIQYEGLSRHGTLLYWIKDSLEDEYNKEEQAPRWILLDEKTNKHEQILLGEQSQWAKEKGINEGTLHNFLFRNGNVKLMAERYVLIKTPEHTSEKLDKIQP